MDQPDQRLESFNMTNRKLIDSFIFFNELSTLNMRLHELNDCVDYFVIVEAGLTHAGNVKPMYYNDNKSLFEPFADKIIHFIVDDVPAKARSWRKLFQHRNAIEFHQRNAQIEAVSRVPGIKPTDIVLTSDADEIPSPEYLRPELFDDESIFVFNQRYFFYDFTSENPIGWPGTMSAPYRHFVDLDLNRMRKTKHRKMDERVTYTPAQVSREEHAGWHCSNFGGVDRIVTKLEAFAHQQYNQPKFKDRERLEGLIRDKKDWVSRGDDQHQLRENDPDTDEYLPRYWKLIYEEI
jgi:beta-1,4-mannosyl-glycoprotein beta-1,4-N-acetylglucosaminyltransferase